MNQLQFPQGWNCFMFLVSFTSIFFHFLTGMDREWQCWLTVPWTHFRGLSAPCGKACHSESGWHCLCGRSSWSSQALAPAEAHQRCLTLESLHRSASLEAKCQGSDRQTDREYIHRGRREGGAIKEYTYKESDTGNQTHYIWCSCLLGHDFYTNLTITYWITVMLKNRLVKEKEINCPQL